MKTVIVVDDDNNIRDTIVDILNLEGYCAEGFPGAQGVLDRLNKDNVSLVVTDLNMPDIDGMELLQSVVELAKTKNRQLPVILLTGAGFEERGAEALKLGAFACFAKPFDIDEFIESVVKAIGKPDGGTGG